MIFGIDAGARRGPHPARSEFPPCIGVPASSQDWAGRPGDTQKNFAALVAAVISSHAQGKPIELWWQDEARVGQQCCLTYIWAKRGCRPAGLRDLRYRRAYIFGSICPAHGVAQRWFCPMPTRR